MEMLRIIEPATTDILEVRLIRAQLAIALVRTNTSNEWFLRDEFMTPKEYDPANDSGSPYVASRGHTLVSMDFEIMNLDRASLDFRLDDTSYITIEYNGVQTRSIK